MLRGDCDYAVVPFENSTNGSVVFTLDILRDIYHNPKSMEPIAPASVSIHVAHEVYVPINHCLLSPATSTSQIKRLYTHPQAWGQCDIFTRKTFPGDIEKIDTNSTSAAAEIVKTDPEGAAIAAAAAGSVHNVPVLVKNISNQSDNTTRFLVFSRLNPDMRDELLNYIEQPTTRNVPPTNAATLMSLVVPHNSPGALCSTLQEFAKQGISLTSINSRPSGREHWTYVFFIEFLGSQMEYHISEAIRNASKHCQESTIIGSFPRARE